jgi:hypothetical protein
MKIRPIRKRIIAINGDLDDTVTAAGIVLKTRVDRESGITPRWFQVFSVGNGINWVSPEQWVLVEYGRWTEGFILEDERLPENTRAWRIDPKGCLMVSDHKPDTLYYNSKL